VSFYSRFLMAAVFPDGRLAIFLAESGDARRCRIKDTRRLRRFNYDTPKAQTVKSPVAGLGDKPRGSY
jgi:hypothetical protein